MITVALKKRNQNFIGKCRKRSFRDSNIDPEAVNEQIRGFIAPLSRQLEELIGLVQGVVTTQHLDHYPRADFGTTSGTVTYQSDSKDYIK